MLKKNLKRIVNNTLFKGDFTSYSFSLFAFIGVNKEAIDQG